MDQAPIGHEGTRGLCSFSVGTVRMAVGEHDAAVDEFRAGLVSDPGTAEHWFQLGRLLGRSRDEAGAAHQWRRAYCCDPGRDRILRDLITLLRRVGNAPAGWLSDWWRRVYRSSDQTMFRTFIDLMVVSGDLKSAFGIRVLRSALLENPNNESLYRLLGDERVSPASRDLRQVFRLRLLRLGAVDANTLRTVGYYARETERYEIAATYLKRSILYNPTRNIAYFTMFFLSRNRDTIEGARSFLRHAWCVLYRKANGAGTEHLLRRFAELERANGDTGPLIPRFEKERANPSLDQVSWRSMTRELARCQIEAGDIPGAFANLQSLERFRPNEPSSYLLADWASYHYQAGNRGEYDQLVDRRFIRSFELSDIAPDLDVQTFNAALRRLVTNHPSLNAGSDGGQADMRQTGDKGPGSLLEDQAPELVDLSRYFEILLQKYRQALPDDPHHPFLKYKDVPAPMALFWGLVIRNCDEVYTHRHGEETFASAIYYAHEPEDIEDPENPRSGWFEALRSDLNIEMDSADVLEFEARPGRFLFIPSYFYHRAMPTKLSRKRVSIVADFNYSFEA